MTDRLSHIDTQATDQNGRPASFYSSIFFYKGRRLTNESDLGGDGARKIEGNAALWHGLTTRQPGDMGLGALDKPEPSGLDLRLSRDFLQPKK